MPYMGLTLAVVWGLVLPIQHWCTVWPYRRPLLLRGACVVAGLVVGGHAVGTYQRNTVWRTEETLWSDVVQKSPTNGRAWMNYALSVMGRGDYREAKRLFEQAQRYAPYYASLEANLGIVNDQLGAPRVAEPHFQRALQLDPDFVGGHYFYARWLVKQSRAREALPLLQRALTLSPGFYAARALLIQLYGVREAKAELAALIQETLVLSPTDPLALAYARERLASRCQRQARKRTTNAGWS